MIDALLLAVSLFAATPIPEDTPPPDESVSDVMEDAPIDVDVTEPSDARKLGADFVDPNFLFTIPSPGAEWLRISPVDTAPTLRAAFVHLRGSSMLAMISVTVDSNPSPKDPPGYAQAAFRTLTSPPLLFKIEKKGPLKVAGRTAYTVQFQSAKGDRTYEQVYLPGKSGSLVVLTFQAPTATFAREQAAFRQSAGRLTFE